MRGALVGVLVLAGACQGREQRGADTARRAPAVSTVASAVAESVYAVQLGAFSDSATARRMRDSLNAAGWRAWLRGSTGKAAPAVRVRIAASRDSVLPGLVVAALLAAKREAVVERDVVAGDTLLATVAVPVSRGAHGITAGTRWVVAGDRHALLVVEDPSSVEAEPVADGFAFGDESSGHIVQRDSVWDVAPSPDWSRVAVGIAYAVPGRGGAPSASDWRTLAQRTGLSADSTRKAAFPVSGMSGALGLAQPAIYDLTAAAPAGASKAIVLPLAGGWRVGWTAAGDVLLVGTNPKRAMDDEPASGWIAVDLRGARVTAPSDGPAPVAWTTGPTIDLSVPPDFVSAHTIAAGARTIESGGGWVRVREGNASRIVGPGTALVATATGRYIAALVPNAPAKGEPPAAQPARLVLYDLGR